MEADNIDAPFPLMRERPAAAKNTRATWLGLFVSLFAMVVIRQAFVFFVPEITFAAAIRKRSFGRAQPLSLLSYVAAKAYHLDRSASAHVTGGNRLPGAL